MMLLAVCRALNMEQEQKEKEKEKDAVSLLPTVAPTSTDNDTGNLAFILIIIVKPVPDITYKVFGGTLNLTLSVCDSLIFMLLL